MKQNITSKQLKELTFEQVNYLGKYTKVISYPSTQEEWEDSKENEYLTMYITLLERLNIGKLIEILCDSDFCYPHIGLTESRKRSKCIVVGVTCLSGSEEFRGKTFEADELCDALWEAVKKVI